MLDEISKNSDHLSEGFRLKTYFNYYIKNSKSGMDKVRVMQTDLEIIMLTFYRQK